MSGHCTTHALDGDHHRHSHSHAHHHHHQDYDHHHDHGHSHAPASFGRAFAIGTALNFGFVLVEAGYGISAGSMALLADAGHNLGDVLGLVIAWTAATLGQRRAAGRYTYGLRSSSILAAFLNALLLMGVLVVIAVEAVHRLVEPAPVSGGIVMIVATAGLIVNGATALMFMRGRNGDLNIRGAFLHMTADAAISAGVVVAGYAMLRTGLLWIDPVVSLAIVFVIAVGTWGLLWESVNMTLHAAPIGVDPVEIEHFLRARDGVEDIHDLHVWPMSTTETALTAHLLVPSGYPGDQFVADIALALRQAFAIDHATIQIEIDEEVPCALAHRH
jgi:cobalt-zinc-cadmium efflux system protein